MPFYAYILRSVKTSRYYYGHCSNVEIRIKNHNSGKVRSTKANRPWEMYYCEEFRTKSEAAQREYFFKSIEGYNNLRENNFI